MRATDGKKGRTGPAEKAGLRRRAEDRLKAKKTAKSPSDPGADPQKLLQELQVHQIELEMQNEELRRTQVELDTARSRYFDLYDLAPVSYCTVSEKGLILESNLTAATLLGAARAALIGQPISRFIHQEDQDIYDLQCKRLFDPHPADSGQAGESKGCELRMVKMDGTLFWAHLEATAAHDAEGAPILRVVLSNISDRKQLEAEKGIIEGQSRQLQKAESLGRMAGAIAHHFNNQLGVVIGSLDLAIMELSQGQSPHAQIVAAMKAAYRAAEISGLMLTYLGQTVDKRTSFDLSEACRRNLSLIRAAIPNRIILETDLPSPGPLICANTNQIQQILANLATNSGEALGESRGAIHLDVKTVLAAEIPASHRFPIGWQPQNEAYACLEVIDAGCGIARDDIEKIFDPFFSSKFTGRGMGLAVVLGIVRAHGGAITVDSEPGRGSTVSVFLPLSAEEMPQQADSAAQPLEMEKGGTVLLVEDEEMVRNMAADILRHLGFAVLEAKDGIEAVNLFRNHQDEIHCVLCDLTMPRMNGWETLTVLRKLDPDLPVILTSGYSKAAVMAGSHPEIPQVFLGKPYNLKELSDAIHQALTHRKK